MGYSDPCFLVQLISNHGFLKYISLSSKKHSLFEPSLKEGWNPLNLTWHLPGVSLDNSPSKPPILRYCCSFSGKSTSKSKIAHVPHWVGRPDVFGRFGRKKIIFTQVYSSIAESLLTLIGDIGVLFSWFPSRYFSNGHVWQAGWVWCGGCLPPLVRSPTPQKHWPCWFWFLNMRVS